MQWIHVWSHMYWEKHAQLLNTWKWKFRREKSVRIQFYTIYGNTMARADVNSNSNRSWHDRIRNDSGCSLPPSPHFWVLENAQGSKVNLILLSCVIRYYVIALMTWMDRRYGNLDDISEVVHNEVHDTVRFIATWIFFIFLFTIATTLFPLFIIAGGRDTISSTRR